MSSPAVMRQFPSADARRIDEKQGDVGAPAGENSGDVTGLLSEAPDAKSGEVGHSPVWELARASPASSRSRKVRFLKSGELALTRYRTLTSGHRKPSGLVIIADLDNIAECHPGLTHPPKRTTTGAGTSTTPSRPVPGRSQVSDQISVPPRSLEILANRHQSQAGCGRPASCLRAS